MFNIIETLWNYFTHELPSDSFSSEVGLHFNVSQWRPYLVVSYSEEVFLLASAAPLCPTVVHEIRWSNSTMQSGIYH